MSGDLQILALDVYGTLLNTASISSDIRTLFGVDAEKATKIASQWRRYQLEYTWRLNSMGLYESFDHVTRRSFLHAAAESHLAVDEATADRVLERYNHLALFDDALPALQQLHKLPHVKIVIFSNGTHRMISSALANAPLSIVPHGGFFADEVQTYKPSRKIYEALVAYINATPKVNEGRGVIPENVWLVSGNPFDVTGARAAGLKAIWIDRPSSGWMDHVAPEGHDLMPIKVVRTLEEITTIMRELK